MDVNFNHLAGRALLPGTTPLWRSQPLPAAFVATQSGGGGAPALQAGALPPSEVRGTPDGPDIVLNSGVHVRRMKIGQLRVSESQVLEAVKAVQLLPMQHQLLLARSGVPIELVPVQQLEQVHAGTSDPVLGATTITNTGGRWSPQLIRVAVNSPLSAPGSVTAIGEVVQHEIGHAIAVVGSQDRSEETAIQYAATY